MREKRSQRRGELLLLGLAFFTSGASALVYQVSWQRILALHSGIGIVSIALIVSSFMLGLGLGSHAGGVQSVGLDPKRALGAFALLELLVALFGFLSPYLFYDVLYLRASELYASLWVAGPLHFASLILPTTLMGMSLPFLSRAAVRDVATAGRVIGYLYGINVLGASLGALSTPWILIRLFGIRGAIAFAAAGNLIAMGVALSLYIRAPTSESASRKDTPPPETLDRAPHHPFALWMALYFLSGFCALALELVWFRIVDLGAKTTAFSFGTVLALFLAGNALGSLLGILLVPRIARPLRVFLSCQTALLVGSGFSVLLLVSLPPGTPYFEWYYEYWGQPRAFDVSGHPFTMDAFKLYGILPLFLFGLPTILMGFSFPVLHRAVQTDVRTSGRKVGFLQAANISGNVAGSLVTGLLLMASIGATGTLRLLLVAGLVFAVVGIAREGMRIPSTALGAALVPLFVLLPDQDALWKRLHGADDAAALVAEDDTGVAAIVPESERRYRVFVNGKSHSWIPYGGVHTRLGALPALIHPAPKDVAIIGLGSGDTAWGAGLRPETRSIRVYEISGQQPVLLRELASTESVREDIRLGLSALLDDPRVRIVTGDGRQALQHGDALYDLIEADAVTTDMAYSGNLYSVEFFDLCRRRLKPGGVMCTWSPTPRVYRAFLEAFPYVLEMEDRGILVGSNELIPIERRAWRDRTLSPEVVDYLGSLSLAQRVLEGLRTVRKAEKPSTTEDVNRDLFPRDEFRTP
jgi:predicted membrane-bound spermidine synthase